MTAGLPEGDPQVGDRRSLPTAAEAMASAARRFIPMTTNRKMMYMSLEGAADARAVLASTHVAGGAGIAALKLHQGLRRIGVDSCLLNRQLWQPEEGLVRFPASARKKAISTWTKAKKRSRLFRPYSFDRSHWIRRIPACEMFSDFRSETGRLDLHNLPECAVFNFHWVSFFLDLPTVIRRYKRRTPLVWTLHDMNAFTGGCHYDAGCGRFRQGCGCCPMLVRSGEGDISSRILASKLTAISELRDDELTIVTPSRWLQSEVQKSPLLSRFDCQVIPYGVDTSTFAPGEKEIARRQLGLDDGDEGTVNLLFVASGIRNPRKGFDLLVNAIGQLPEDLGPLRLLVVGEGELPQQLLSLVPCRAFGAIVDPSLLATIYSAADAFVIPSREDNLPNTVLESLACGTPVVGFRVGGIPDMVRPGATGWLADECSPACLAGAIAQAVASCRRGDRYKHQCTEVVSSEYTLTAQAQSYSQLFRELCRRPWATGNPRYFGKDRTVRKVAA